MYIDLQVADKTGRNRFIWGAISAFVVVYVYFVIPELKGRALEEIDYMYDIGVPARQMGTYVIDKDQLPTSQRSVTEEEPMDEKDGKLAGDISHME